MSFIIGPPSWCPELRFRLSELPDDASIADILKVISVWEEWAVKDHKRREQIAKL